MLDQQYPPTGLVKLNDKEALALFGASIAAISAATVPTKRIDMV